MIRVALIRHAPTAWTAERRVQGRSDVPLGAAGRAAAATWRVPGEFAGWRWLSSPLARARETARILHGRDADTDDRLVEASWGAWEGLDRPEVARREAALVAAGAAPGLDFAPPGGDSPNALWVRVKPLLADLAAGGRDCVLVTHSGVLRIVHAMATGWDMTDKPRPRIRDACAQVYRIGRDGTPTLERANLPLDGGGVLIHVQHLLGVGHLMRAAALARAVVARGVPVALASGGPPVADLDTGGARLVQLPPLRAEDATFRRLVDPHGRPLDESMRAARRDRLLALLDETRPRVVVTEMFPFGRRALRFELLPLLDAAAALDPPARIVGSVRDILVRKPNADRYREMADIASDRFDHILVHSDPAVVPFEASFPLADRLAGRLRYTGFAAQARNTTSADGRDEVVVSAGGGPVGPRLFRCALEACRLGGGGGRRWRLLVAHGIDGESFAALRDAAPDAARVERARPDFPGLLRNCAVSVSQAGYNTVMDILAAGCRAVLVPFAEAAETEQAQRAEILARRGLATRLDQATLTPEALAAAVDAALAGPAPGFPPVRMDGIEDSGTFLADLATARTVMQRP